MAVGRFAPSPTGDLHLGNLRTAVLAWMWARHDGSEFVLRMEDLDRVTSSRDHERSQEHDLSAVGLDWDGAVVRQSDRFERYHDAIAQLEGAGLVYPCYCTRREIAAAASAPHVPNAEGYPGTCRNLSDRRRRELEAEGRPPALRFAAADRPARFVDAVLGPVTGPADDVVVRRNDGVPAYHLAVVVDDAAQGIELVVRGDDLATAVPSQMALQAALGLPTLRYGHVPLVLGPDGRRLAKRDGAVTLTDRMLLGDEPVDVTRWLLTSCGIALDPDGSPREIMAVAAARFDVGRLPRGPVRLDDVTARTSWHGHGSPPAQQSAGPAIANVVEASSAAPIASPDPSGSDRA